MAKRMPSDLSGEPAGQVSSMTGPERYQHWGVQGWFGHESGYLMVKFTHQLGKKFPCEDLHPAGIGLLRGRPGHRRGLCGAACEQ